MLYSKPGFFDERPHQTWTHAEKRRYHLNMEERKKLAAKERIEAARERRAMAEESARNLKPRSNKSSKR